MIDQFKKIYSDVMASKSWTTSAIAGTVCLVAVFLKPLLFLLALFFFGRALYLGYPELVKKYKENK